jgi:hypothetical protein
MAKELGRDQGWVDGQVAAFTALTGGYRMNDCKQDTRKAATADDADMRR